MLLNFHILKFPHVDFSAFLLLLISNFISLIGKDTWHDFTSRDKKAFLSEQCQEIEGKDRIRKTRNLFKKIGDIKRTLHARIGTRKDRNAEDLTEAGEIKKRYKNAQKNYTKKSQ